MGDGASLEDQRIAVVGAGPAGFYATDMLLKQGASVDLFERLPAPFGLLRYGVAPDHQKIKRAGAAFERTAVHASCRYFGNVEVGARLSIEELLNDYDQVLVATGSATDRRLGIPGEDLLGSVAATSFVGWYNGHPDFAALTFDLESERAVIVGVGNVALDVARILVRRPSELRETDIADYALAQLERSRVREVVVLGRRGPAQAAFDTGELADIADLSGVEVVVEGDVSFEANAELPTASRRNLEFLATLPRAPTGKAERLVRLRFLTAPKALHGIGPHVGAIEVERTELVERPDGSVTAKLTGDVSRISTGLVIRSVGYRATPLPGLPFDERAAIIPNVHGRVGVSGDFVPRCYVVGWVKRGAVGLLGSNKQDAKDTVDQMVADAPLARSGRPNRRAGSVVQLLKERGVRFVSYAEWQRIDELERARGAENGKLREKFATVESLLNALDTSA